MSGRAVLGGSLIFTEMYDPELPRISLTRETRTDVRTGTVTHANLETFNAECFPTFFPARHPARTWLLVSQVDVEPIGGEPAGYTSDGIAYWDLYKATVTYKNPDAEQGGGRQQEPPDGGASTYLTVRKNSTGEFMTLPSSALRWEDQAVGEHVLEDEVSAAKVIPVIEWVVTQYFVTEVPEDRIRATIGKVNSKGFLGATAGTLLYMGAEEDYAFATDGTKTYTLSHRFHEKRIESGGNTYGWNHFLRPDDGLWKQLLNDDGKPVHEEVPFDVLF